MLLEVHCMSAYQDDYSTWYKQVFPIRVTFVDVERMQDIVAHPCPLCESVILHMVAQDARLCVRVFKLLIDLNIRHFDLNAFLTVLSDSLLSSLAVFTQNEATNYAQFVKGVMQLLRRWWQAEVQ